MMQLLCSLSEASELAAFEWISGAAAAAWFEGQHEREVLRRLKLRCRPRHRQRRNIEIHDPARMKRPGQFVFPDGSKSVITAIRAGTNAEDRGFLPDFRAGLVGQRQHPAGRRVGRRRNAAGRRLLCRARSAKAPVRFRAAWQWNGGPAVLQSRAPTTRVCVQPTRAQFGDERGIAWGLHYTRHRKLAHRREGGG